MLPRNLGKNAAIVFGLLAAGFVAAWLRFRDHLGETGAYTDGTRTYDTREAGAVRYAVWEAPELLGGSLNSASSESHPALSPDGRWLVFVTGERSSNSDLWVAAMRSGAPVDPRPLAALDSVSDECSPAFAGDALYFASDRPGGAGGLDLYRAPYSDGEFGAAVRVGDPVNTASDDCDPAPRPGTRELVFASNRKGGGYDLFVADAATTGAPTLLESLETDRDEREPAFTADGRTLFFASNRASGGADFDLYRSSASEEGWTAPVPLAGLNTEASERAPAPAFDDFSLYFARDPGSGAFDLLRARSIELFRLPGRPVGWLELMLLAALLALALLAWLAKRWPKLDTLYKCYLVSLIVHFLLLLWFTDLFPGSGSADAGTRRDGFRVHLASSASTARTASRERAGQLESERSAAAESASAPERLAAELGSTPASAPAMPVSAPSPGEPDLPERSETSSGTAPTPEILLADREAVERRSGTVRGLALPESSSAAAEGARAPSAAVGPQRGRATATADGPAAPSVDGKLVAPVAPAEAAPGRDRVALAPASKSATGAPVAVESPRAELAAAPRASRGLSLDGLADAGGERTAASAPERPSGTGSRASSPPASEVLPGGSIAALAPKSSGELAPAPGRANLEREPGGAPRAEVGLRDAEHIPRTAESGVGTPGGSSDVLDALAAPAAAREGGRDRGAESAPQKQRIASGTPAPASEPPALAIAAPPDRPVEAPPRPQKSWEDTPYQNRAGEEKARALELHGGTRETEEAVAKGLAYLARIQRPTGEWGDIEVLDGKYGEVAVGKTGLALLAFLGAGHTHASKTQYSENAARAVAFLLGKQDEESGHFGDTEAYSHGIATYALAECYALTGDASLEAPLERAVAHILSKQIHAKTPDRFGGWSYYYRDDRVFDRWPRTSITAWQVMALESARLGGIQVPSQVFEDAATFIDNAEDTEQGWYRYNHDPERLQSSWPTLPASTPAGLFALSLVGRDIATEPYAETRAFVLSRTPRQYRRGSADEFVHQGQGNLYFWYYGTLAMFRVGGSAWERWNVGMKETLLRGQRKDGSWAPIDVYCQYARDDENDRSYSTAMCVLSLEVYYRYYLPLLKVR